MVLAVALFSLLMFEPLHSDHDSANCHDEDCPICLILQIVQNTIKVAVPVPPIKPLEHLLFIAEREKVFTIYLISITPVSQKERLIS